MLILEIGLVIVAYYMGKNGIAVDDVYCLAKHLLERDNDEEE